MYLGDRLSASADPYLVRVLQLLAGSGVETAGLPQDHGEFMQQMTASDSVVAVKEQRHAMTAPHALGPVPEQRAQ